MLYERPLNLVSPPVPGSGPVAAGTGPVTGAMTRRLEHGPPTAAGWPLPETRCLGRRVLGVRQWRLYVEGAAQSRFVNCRLASLCFSQIFAVTCTFTRSAPFPGLEVHVYTESVISAVSRPRTDQPQNLLRFGPDGPRHRHRVQTQGRLLL